MKRGARITCHVASRRGPGEALAHFRGEGLTEDLAGTVIDQIDDERCLVRLVLDGRKVDVMKLIEEMSLAGEEDNADCSKIDDTAMDSSVER